MYGIIMCPSLKRFPVQPQDQSLSKLIDCPHCGLQAWLSEKKQNLMKNLPRYELYCYDCLEEKAMGDPDWMKKSLRVDI